MRFQFSAGLQVTTLLITICLVMPSHASDKVNDHLFLSESDQPRSVFSGQYKSVSCPDLFLISDYVNDPISSVADKFPFRPCYQRHQNPGRDILSNAFVSDGHRIVRLRHWVSPVDNAGTITSMGALEHKQRNNALVKSWLTDDLPLHVVLYSGKPVKLNENITIIIE